MKQQKFNKIINKKISFDYQIDYEKEAGIVLTGDEVKSLRRAGPSLHGVYAYVKNQEMFVKNLNLKHAYNGDREKKLLLNKNEIHKIISLMFQKCYAILILEIYETRGFFKIKIGVCKRLKKHTKKEIEKKKDMEKQIKTYF